MSDIPSKKKLPWGRWASYVCLLAVGIVVGVFGAQWWAAETRRPFVEGFVLQSTSPLAITITFRPDKSIAGDDGLAMLGGPVEYHFTNTTTQPWKVAFPPVRAFSFGRSHVWRSDVTPEFARQKRILELKPGESMSFQDTASTMATGGYPENVNGELGWTGFVFSRPAEAKSDDGYCVGTVFPSFYCLPLGKPGQHPAIIAERDAAVACQVESNQLFADAGAGTD